MRRRRTQPTPFVPGAVDGVETGLLTTAKKTVELRELLRLDRDWTAVLLSDADNERRAMLRGRIR